MKGYEKALPEWQKQARANRKKYARFLDRCSPREIIPKLQALHEEAFQIHHCLNCANCCKNHSPRFKQPDIKRISRHLGMKEGEFIQTWLRLDEDNDFVLKVQPCAFLEKDNTCRIYEVRPSDCARYPYTDEDTLIKRKSLTLTNATVCPAVHYILEKLS